jgi:hypothetical protein
VVFMRFFPCMVFDNDKWLFQNHTGTMLDYNELQRAHTAESSTHLIILVSANNKNGSEVQRSTYT